MVFTASLLNVLFASAALAAPSLSDRIARRRVGSHMSRPLQPVEGPTRSNTSHVEYSSNWAGAVYDSAVGTYSAVTATFVVPTPKAGSGSSSSYAASAWVGIDGDTCGNAILQTGVDFTITSGSVSYDAWYEWYPDYAYDFSSIPIKAGDTIKLTVTAKTTTSGTAVIENVSTGKTVSKSITSTSALCQQNAEWIVEDFEEGSSLVPFANFGTVSFTNALATTSSGTVGPSGATIIDIKQGSTVYTSVTTSSSGAVVKYV